MKTHPAAELFPLLQGDELAALAADVKKHGLRVPIVILDDQILDGRNRFAACKLAGVAPRFEAWKGSGSPVEWVLSINLHRRHLNESQRAMVAARAKPMFEEEAAKRMTEGRNQHSPSANLRYPTESQRAVEAAKIYSDVKGKAAAQASKSVNVSARSVEAASAVLKRASPEVIRAVESGRVAVSAAAALLDRPKIQQTEIVRKVEAGEAKSVREALRQVKREDLAAKGTELPKGPKRYRVLYADPPWQYNDSLALPGKDSSAAEHHYPTMSVEELATLDVRGLAEPDAVLFCWATFPLLPDCLAVVRAWGFVYKTAFVWAKNRTTFGHYHDASAELLLLCTRGSCTPDTDKREKQVQTVPHPGRHSAKPEDFRAMVGRLYTQGNRIELFRRGAAPAGWDVFGNEAVGI
jgi:N6-adenosine-specific RNA methylase IME4